jgi:hypothetical protein
MSRPWMLSPRLSLGTLVSTSKLSLDIQFGSLLDPRSQTLQDTQFGWFVNQDSCKLMCNPSNIRLVLSSKLSLDPLDFDDRGLVPLYSRHTVHTA